MQNTDISKLENGNTQRFTDIPINIKENDSITYEYKHLFISKILKIKFKLRLKAIKTFIH